MCRANVLHTFITKFTMDSSVLSESMKTFAKSPNMSTELQLTKAWVEETAGMSNPLTMRLLLTPLVLGKQIDDGPPSPAVYPDLSNDLYPLLPPYDCMKQGEVQKLFRAYVTKVWRKYLAFSTHFSKR